jgi:inner membrane protein
METGESKKFVQTHTFKLLVIAALALLLLIPKAMITGLIEERQERSRDTVNRINEKWSQSQVICGPVLSIPYSIKEVSTDIIHMGEGKTEQKEKVFYTHFVYNIIPEHLKVNTELLPEEKHYGIYKTILYRSNNELTGEFIFNPKELGEAIIHWEKAYMTLGISDLKGVNNLEFYVNSQSCPVKAGGKTDGYSGKSLMIDLHEFPLQQSEGKIFFKCNLNLNGSNHISYVPVGKTTEVNVNGEWTAPGFVGEFSPVYTLTDTGFSANWNILHFNRNIPDSWIGHEVNTYDFKSFGVALVDTVDHYQQNMRSAKYAVMFIVLTFSMFFFVEVLTRKKIHPIQYLLVGVALILFYTLLLSVSEQGGFGIAYLIASIATISLIVAYGYSIFRNKKQTAILALLLTVLYVFLYVILQLEDIALLIGSIGLFIILGGVMYLSRKINWYKLENN